jgi:hypothetical protein
MPFFFCVSHRRLSFRSKSTRKKEIKSGYFQGGGTIIFPHRIITGFRAGAGAKKETRQGNEPLGKSRWEADANRLSHFFSPLRVDGEFLP